MQEETLIRKAEFDPKVCSYWLVSGIVTMTLIVVGIPFLPIWIVLGLKYTKKYLANMECLLTNKTLKIKKGVLIRVEKTVPLEKITDMGMVQGPIMRKFDLYTLTVETAGQSAQGALVSLTGIVNAQDFREAVLAQRDAVSASSSPKSTEPSQRESKDATSVLQEIRDALLRIEEDLKNKTGL